MYIPDGGIRIIYDSFLKIYSIRINYIWIITFFM